MPCRYIPIIKDQIYHVFNQGIARQPIFLKPRDYSRALETIRYYSYLEPSLRFSHYDRLPLEQRADFLKRLKTNNPKQVQILAFCLMPNHVHFLIKEIMSKGISGFMRHFQNSYAKYFNTKMGRNGALFQSMFKVVRIETDEQLLHVTRYIHLNPLSSYILKDPGALGDYLWSSFREYLGKREEGIVDTSLILGFFSSLEKFKSFTLDQVDYQRRLEEIKHLVYE